MATTERITTAEQLLRATGLGRCELLRGELVMMSPSGAEHGYIVVNVTTALAVFVKRKGLGRVYGAETGFQIEWNPDTVRAPDVTFVTAARVAGQPSEGFFQGPPDLAVEVTSPGDRPSEVKSKAEQWLDAGCRRVWVVNPQSRSVTVYRRDAATIVLSGGAQLTGEDVLPGFTLPLAEIFA